MLTDSMGQPKPGASTVLVTRSVYRELSGKNGNLILSPYSIAAALVVLLTGSNGSTREEIEWVLGGGRRQRDVNYLEAFRKIRTQLGERRGVELLVANGLWCQKGYPIEREYVEHLARALSTQIASVDFAGAPGEAADTVNAWVRESTRHKIDSILSASDLSSLTRVVLANAVYFKGDWTFPFPEPSTRPEPFHLHDGSSIDVPTMHLRARLRYANRRGLQYLELPYGVDYTRMLLLLPERDGLEAIERALEAEELHGAVKALDERVVTLSMPRFRFTCFFRLRYVLEHLGISTAFRQDADFSRISSESGFAVSEILHEAFVDVTESGTEASAVTVSTVIGGFVPEPSPVVMRVDRPFVFLIYDAATGAVLFLGRVMDPREG